MYDPHNRHNSSDNNWLFDEHEWNEIKKTHNKQSDQLFTTRLIAFLKNQYKKFVQSNKSKLSSSFSSKDKLDISLKLSLPRPSVKKTSLALKSAYKNFGKKQAGLVAAIAILFIGYNLMGQNNSAPGSSPDNQGNPGVLSENIERAEPTFEVVIPEQSETVEKDKVLFDEEKQVASYQDKIGNISVTVSQFPAPEEFELDPEAELKKIADNISANIVVSDAAPRAYLGSSHRGPQIAVFYKDGLLVFIQSSAEVKLLEWNEYIKELY